MKSNVQRRKHTDVKQRNLS